jgi:hypothetical protein
MTTARAGLPREPDGAEPKRILLIGASRSGTTWIGRVLGHCANTAYVDEPDLVETPLEGQAGRHGFGPYPVIAAGESSLRSMRYGSLWDLAFARAAPTGGPLVGLGRALLRVPAPVRDPVVALGARTVARLHRNRSHIVAKSVLAEFCLAWLVERYRPEVVFIQRHPLNVVASWLTLPQPLWGLPDNRDVRERVVAELGLPSPPPPQASHLDRVTWCVGLLTAALHRAASGHPSWTVVTHEAMCDQPGDRFPELAGLLGLAWTDDAARFLVTTQRPGTGRETHRVAGELAHKWRAVLSDADAHEVAQMLSRFPGEGWIRAREPAPSV